MGTRMILTPKSSDVFWEVTVDGEVVTGVVEIDFLHKTVTTADFSQPSHDTFTKQYEVANLVAKSNDGVLTFSWHRGDRKPLKAAHK